MHLLTWRKNSSPARVCAVRMGLDTMRAVNPEERMATLKIELPEPAPAAANYVRLFPNLASIYTSLNRWNSQCILKTIDVYV